MLDMSLAENLALLESCRVGHLGMVGADGRPYTLPVRYVWHDQCVYLRLTYDGREQEALEHCRRVCFELDECQDDFSHYASVLIEGHLEDVMEEAEKKSALVAMNAKYERLAGLRSPGPDPVTRGVAIRKVVVDSISGRKREPDVTVMRRVPLGNLHAHSERRARRVR